MPDQAEQNVHRLVVPGNRTLLLKTETVGPWTERHGCVRVGLDQVPPRTWGSSRTAPTWASAATQDFCIHPLPLLVSGVKRRTPCPKPRPS